MYNPYAQVQHKDAKSKIAYKAGNLIGNKIAGVEKPEGYHRNKYAQKIGYKIGNKIGEKLGKKMAEKLPKDLYANPYGTYGQPFGGPYGNRVGRGKYHQPTVYGKRAMNNMYRNNVKKHSRVYGKNKKEKGAQFTLTGKFNL